MKSWVKWAVAALLAGHGVLSAAASADEPWARKMFAVTSHDFGAVARGADTEFRFEFQNIYKEDVRVSSVRASCGCTTPSVTERSLTTWGKSAIIARYNTDRFMGRKSATITVTFDKPYQAQVQLTVTGYIRPDVVFHPGLVNFGEVDQMNGGSQRVQVTYAGRSDWTIKDVRSAHEHLAVRLQEPVRSRSQVTYEMLVDLQPGADPGFFNDQLTIVTDDQRNQRLTLPVSGNVRSLLTVSPASLYLGMLKPQESVTKRLIVQSSQPFQVLSIDCGDDPCFEARQPNSKESKKLHVIPITFSAGSTASEVEQLISIRTNLGSGTTVATGTVMP